MANAVIFFAPLHAVGFSSESTTLSFGEFLCITLWIFAFSMENVADSQLANWKRENRGGNSLGVCEIGTTN